MLKKFQILDSLKLRLMILQPGICIFKRFNQMSNGENFLKKSQFRENMGLLGIDTTSFLTEKIFDIIDENCDEKVIIK